MIIPVIIADVNISKHIVRLFGWRRNLNLSVSGVQNNMRHERSPSETSKIAILGIFWSREHYYDVTMASQHIFYGPWMVIYVKFQVVNTLQGLAASTITPVWAILSSRSNENHLFRVRYRFTTYQIGFELVFQRVIVQFFPWKHSDMGSRHEWTPPWVF